MIACFGSVDKVPPVQLREMRQAFFAGSQHLFGSIMSFLNSGEEPTDANLARMSLIEMELQKFISEFARDHVPTKVRA